MRSLVDLFFNPPMAIARVGASDTPMVAFEWRAATAAHSGTQTVIDPSLSFEVQADGGLKPFMPTEIRFKEDDGSIRPVAPFIELWARLQRSEDGLLEEAPVTLQLLAELGINLKHVAVEVTASNNKAARRTGYNACSFTARAEIAGTDHGVHALRAFSRHTSGQQPLVLHDKPIPLGQVQWIKPSPRLDPEFPEVDLSVLRLRFTPAKGEVYGPPRAAYGPDRQTVTGANDTLEFTAKEDGRIHMIVKPENRILSDDTPFSSYRMLTGLFEDPQPQDGYDGSDEGDNTAWGVVDDTCDALISASVAWQGGRCTANARVFVGPPQYAPDRRPFYGIDADLQDRDEPLMEVDADNFDEVKDQVVELFRRVFETASSLNLDASRTEALQDNAAKISASTPPTPGLPAVGAASMTRTDTPYVDRVPDLTPGQRESVFTTSVRGDRLTYTEVVPFVHGQLMDEAVLLDFLRRKHAHVRRLLRPPFGTLPEWDLEPGPQPNPAFRDPRVLRDLMHDMRMPPYMRDAFYVPLSLTRRQYHMMIDFLDLLAAQETQATPQAQP
ncbi:MAG: hypothetical protein Q8R98_22885 [Rubrivivax sp.]|nr:hypothetical protein [Rubrivivax sp.]MDP3614697.1 hypothetical protein [Rubrivivax sp.]